MIEETAVIVKTTGEFAEVETQRSTACGSCSAKTGCGTSLLATVFGKRRSLIKVMNPIQAQPGDRVVIGLDEAPFLRAAFSLYLVPILGMMGGALLGEWLATRTAAESTELASLLGGVSGLALGLGWLKWFSRSTSSDARYQAVVLRKASPSPFRVELP